MSVKRSPFRARVIGWNSPLAAMSLASSVSPFASGWSRPLSGSAWSIRLIWIGGYGPEFGRRLEGLDGERSVELGDDEDDATAFADVAADPIGGEGDGVGMADSDDSSVAGQGVFGSCSGVSICEFLGHSVSLL